MRGGLILFLKKKHQKNELKSIVQDIFKFGSKESDESHSALKLEKSAISKLQKKPLFAFSKMAKNLFLHQKNV